MRTLLAITLACTLGYIAAMAIIHLGPRHGGIGIAVLAALVLFVELANAVCRDRTRR